MRHDGLRILFVLSLVCGAWSPAFAQSALERLERQIRQRVGGPAGDSPQAAAPAPSPPPAAARGAGNAATGYLGMVADDQNDRGRGVRVVEVYRGGPADKAGLRKQDLITSIGGIRVRQMTDMADMLDTFMPGQSVDFELLRDGRLLKLRATMAARPLAAERPGGMPEAIPLPPGEAIPKPPEPGLGPEPVPLPPEATPPSQSARIEQLQRRIDELEHRVAELERQLAAAQKKDQKP